MAKKLDYQRKTEIAAPPKTKTGPGYLPGDQRKGHKIFKTKVGPTQAESDRRRAAAQADVQKLIDRHNANYDRAAKFHADPQAYPSSAPLEAGARIPEEYTFRSANGQLYKTYSDADYDQWQCARPGLCTPVRLPLTGSERKAVVKITAGVTIGFTILGILLSL